MTAPIIGIAYSDLAKRDNEMRIRTYVSRKYYHAVQLSGGIPILLPAPLPESAGGNIEDTRKLVSEYLKLCHGVLFAGGCDVDPKYQGEDPDPALGSTNPFRDEFEIELLKAAYHDTSMPIFGVCRGCQLVAVGLGGKLYQDIGKTAKIQHSQEAPRWASGHKIKITPDSLLASIAGSNEIYVNSFHHQAVRVLPENFTASGMASDGIIEAIEPKNSDRFVLGVQWHPEECFQVGEYSKKLFRAFVESAAEYAGSVKETQKR